MLSTREMDSTEDHFWQLPLELKMMIFGKLGIVDTRNSRLVCSDWLSILNDFVRMKVRLTDNTVMTVKKCSALTVDSLNVKNLRKSVTLSTSRNTVIPDARTIVIDTGNSNTNLMNIWRHNFKNTEVLHIHNGSLAQMSVMNVGMIIPYVNWPVLVELRVRIIETVGPRGVWDLATSRRHIAALTAFFRGLNVPCLKTIRVHSEAGILEVQKHPLSDFYEQLLSFLVRHKDTIVVFDLFARGKFIENHLEGINPEGLALVNFGKLSLNFDFDHAQLCMNVSLAGNNLKTLVLDKNYWMRGDIALDAPLCFRDAIQRSRTTLETININKMSLDCSWFDGCTSLKCLELLAWNPTNMKNCGNLPALTELDIECYFVKNWNTQSIEKPETLRDQVLDWIGNCMTNLEILRLEFNFGLNFTAQHFKTLMIRLPKLRMLALTRVELDEFVRLKQENPRESSFKYSIITVVPQATLLRYHIFQMKRTPYGQMCLNLGKYRA